MQQNAKPTAAPKVTKDGRPLHPHEAERVANEFAEDIIRHNVKHPGQNSLNQQAEPSKNK